MKKLLLLVAAASIVTAAHANRTTFPTGESFYGRAVPTTKYDRVVDLAQAKTITINCGDTLTFVSEGQRFSWKFDSIHHTRVPLSAVAPAGFNTAGKVVYIHRNEFEGNN